ncbi:hypothetical protein BC937DRAFT_90158 [Endogone sp. FLAS-F59071]|nr:hypothetical protein BC937DRAFT_90158 [Endogone sp. FLAS-F59071]|eukprot:RUS17292.1 hypothetical protein BC937DRAFT_90158 [Endogone sp. FLAS-F59071]
MSYSYSRTPSNASGWLTKQSSSGFRKTWHKRWFVLKGDELQYFKTEEDPNPHGIIDLNLYNPAMQDPSFKKSRYAFILLPRVVSVDRKPHVIFADSFDEMNHWIKAMQNRLGERSVLDKWLERLDLNTFSSTDHTRPRNQKALSPTFSIATSDSSSKPRGLRKNRSNTSISSSSSSITTAESSLSSEGTFADDAFIGDRKEMSSVQQLKDKLMRTTSLPTIPLPQLPVMIHQVITSAPSSPTHDETFAMQSTIASRRKVALPSLPLKMPDPPLIVCEGDPANGSPGVIFVDTPPPVINDRVRKRRSNSLPRFDKFKTSVLTTPTLGNFAI